VEFAIAAGAVVSWSSQATAAVGLLLAWHGASSLAVHPDCYG